MLPFTREQFVAVFADYNIGVWPVQIVAYALGVGMVASLFVPWRARDRLIGGGLAVMWIWTGATYHWLYFAPVNKAAWLIGALFVLQGAVLLPAAVLRSQLRFGLAPGTAGQIGWFLVAYAAIVYPLIGEWVGHGYPDMPMFGITPCPVTLFTLGLLLLTTAPVPAWLLVIPFLWALVGGSAAFLLDIPQDWLLLFSGAAVPLTAWRNRHRPPEVGRS